MKLEQKYLDKIKAYYDMPNKIEILEEPKFVTDVTDVTVCREVNTGLQDSYETELSQYDTEKQVPTLSETVTNVTSVTKKEPLK
jgi:hypothetical protein